MSTTQNLRNNQDVPKEQHITGVILLGNAEPLLFEQCIASLDFCHRVIVVDSYSTTGGHDIAKAHGAEVYQNKWVNTAVQFQFAFDLIESGWVVTIDHDEICSDALKESILRAVATDSAPQSDSKVGSKVSPKAGYYISRCSWYYDRFFKHSGWYPDRLLRLFRLEKMEMRISGAHESFHPKGPTGIIDHGHIIHYPFSSFANHWEKMGSYAQQGADDMRAKGKKASLFSAIWHAQWKFIRIYFLKQGFRDGKAGFINACFGSFYTFSRYIRLFDASWGAPYTDRPAFLDEKPLNKQP